MKSRATISDYLTAAARHRQPRRVSSCLDHSQIVAFYSRQLDEAEMESIHTHLADCPECLELARDSRQFLQFMTGPVEVDAASITAPSMRPIAQAPTRHGLVAWWDTVEGTFQNPALGLSMAVAAALLLVAGSALVAIHWQHQNQIEQLRTQLREPQERERELQRQLAQQRAQTRELEIQLKKQQCEHAELQKKLASQASGQ